MTNKPTNIKDGVIVSVMHGENFLTPVKEMPAGITTKHNQYIAGHSESGHNHVLESKDMEVLEANGERYVLIKEVAKLFHQKATDIHETHYLAPAIYKITAKTEYDPFQRVVRAVFD